MASDEAKENCGQSCPSHSWERHRTFRNCRSADIAVNRSLQRTNWQLRNSRLVTLVAMIVMLSSVSGSMSSKPSLVQGKHKRLLSHIRSGDTASAKDMEWQILQQRALEIRNNLSERLEYVQKGKRINDIVDWQRNHPVDDIDFSLPSSPFDYATTASHSTGRNSSPFPPDRSNLGFHAVRPAPEPIQPPSTMRLILRSFQLFLHFLPLLITLPLALVSQRFRQNVWYKYLARKIAAAGPTFIKWGQWSSIRTDLFPEAFCGPLEALQSDAPAHSTQVSEQLLLEAFELQEKHSRYSKREHTKRCRLLHTIFDSFDPKPIASGSIAQVHKATINGVPIAVKLRHPEVTRKLDWDAKIMQGAAAMMERTAAPSFLRLKETIQQFCQTLAAQTNLMCEASHLEQLNANFRRWPHVKFPTPIFASEAVIVETFEAGQQSTKLMDYYLNGNDNEGELPIELAEFMVTTGVGIYMKMLIVDNLMHADLHPGNILVDAPRHRDPKLIGVHNHNDDGHKSATLVDAGMVARLTPEESAAFIGIIACLGEGNGKEAAACVLRFSTANARMTQAEYVAFQDDVVLLFAAECRGYGTQVDVGNVLKGLLTLIRKHEITVDANFATLVINLLCIEGLAQKAWPQYNPLDAAKPILTAYRRLTGPDGRRKPLFHLRMAFNQVRKQMRDKLFFEQERRKRAIINELRGVPSGRLLGFGNT